METGLIMDEQISWFYSLLLPDVVKRIRDGEDMAVIGLVEEGIAIGCLAGILDEEEFIIESFFIAPDYRRRGGGELLLNALLSNLPEEVSSISIDFVCTCQEHDDFLLFLIACGFQEQERMYGELYSTTLDKMMNHPLFKNGKEIGQSLSDISPIDLRRLESELLQQGVPFEEGEFTDELLDKNLSRLHFNGDCVDGFFLCRYSEKTGILVVGAWNGSESASLMALMIAYAGEMARQNYKAGTRITVQASNQTIKKMIMELLSDCWRISHYCIYHR